MRLARRAVVLSPTRRAIRQEASMAAGTIYQGEEEAEFSPLHYGEQVGTNELAFWYA